jgi:hypothetical protein
MRSSRSLLAAVLLLLVLVGVGLYLASRWERPRLADQDVREAVYSALHREADTTFVITGYVDLLATARVENTRVLLPNVLDLRLGTTRATVRVPGRVSYGFDLSGFTRENIRVRGDTVELEIPGLQVYSAEPDLARLDVETTTGWARRPVSAQTAERRAVQLLTDALHEQGRAHLYSTLQPRVNTANSLRDLLTPTLQSMGVENPVFSIDMGDGLHIHPDA